MIASVRGRLTLWYAVILAVVLVSYAGAAYAFLAHRLHTEMDRTLWVDFEAAEELARGDAERHHDRPPERWIEVRDESGEVVFRDGPEPPLPETAAGTESLTLASGATQHRECFEIGDRDHWPAGTPVCQSEVVQRSGVLRIERHGALEAGDRRFQIAHGHFQHTELEMSVGKLRRL